MVEESKKLTVMEGEALRALAKNTQAQSLLTQFIPLHGQYDAGLEEFSRVLEARAALEKESMEPLIQKLAQSTVRIQATYQETQGKLGESMPCTQ